MGGKEVSVMWLRFILLLFLISSIPAQAARTLVVFGDSLSAGYGLPQGAGWVSLLEHRLKRDQLDYVVVNASISGETTLGGRNRIQAVLREHRPAVVIVQLGANDGLRGNPLEDTRRNLIAIVEACRKAHARVLLVGMRIPPNYGPVYTRRFEALYAEVARQQNVSLVPFMLQGFATKRDLFQSDGIHPAAEAQPRVLENIYRRLQPMLLTKPR
jgi:acyl-CoA thioesterase I